MKKTGIIDHFEGDYIYVEIGEDTVKIPREGAPAMLAEGTVVIVEDGRIVDAKSVISILMLAVSLISMKSRPSAWKTICAAASSASSAQNPTYKP